MKQINFFLYDETNERKKSVHNCSPFAIVFKLKLCSLQGNLNLFPSCPFGRKKINISSFLRKEV